MIRDRPAEASAGLCCETVISDLGIDFTTSAFLTDIVISAPQCNVQQQLVLQAIAYDASLISLPWKCHWTFSYGDDRDREELCDISV